MRRIVKLVKKKSKEESKNRFIGSSGHRVIWPFWIFDFGF